MKLLKLLTVAFVLIATVSCKNKQKEAKTVVVDTVEETVGKINIDASKLQTATFKIEGMTCAIGCAAKIEKSLAKMEGVSSAKVDFDTKTATVSYDGDKVTKDLLVAKVASNGDQYKVDFAKSCDPAKCDTKCSPDCKDANCTKCAAKKAACKVKCATKSAKCDATKCDTKCSPDCKDTNCPKCAAKKAACKTKCATKGAKCDGKVKCDGKKEACKPGCTKPCCAKKA